MQTVNYFFVINPNPFLLFREGRELPKYFGRTVERAGRDASLLVYGQSVNAPAHAVSPPYLRGLPSASSCRRHALVHAPTVHKIVN